MTAAAVRAGTLLPWVPMVAAVYVIALTPPAPLGWIEDSLLYLDQAQAIRGGDMPSGRYPPGMASTLAVGDLLGLGPAQVVKLTVVALVVLVVVAARRLGGPVAGFVAGLLCCCSPWLVASSRFVMSDPLAALLAVAGLLTLSRPGRAAAVAVVGVMVRLFSVVGVAAMLSVGRRWAVVAGVAAVVLFGSFQWAASGSPFQTGYGKGGAAWDGNHIVGEVSGDGNWLVDGAAAQANTPATPPRDYPNLIAYPLMIVGWTYVFGPPFLSVIGVWALWTRRRTREARYVAAWFAGSLILLLPYFAQSPRFLAPAMMLLTVYTAVGITDLVAAGFDLPSPPRQAVNTRMMAGPKVTSPA